MKFGKATVELAGDNSPLKRTLSKTRRIVSGAARKMGASFKKIFTSALRKTMDSLKWIILGFFGISAAAVKMAMDVEESENLFKVSLGKMAKTAREWSEELAESLRLNAFEVRKNVSTFNAMFKAMGLGTKDALKMSKSLTKLAYDLASFHNMKPEEAFQKLRAGITGEIEPLKTLGIIMNATKVKAKAMEMGLLENKKTLTELEKVQVRYKLLIEQTDLAQGDMGRTLGSTTNIIRALKAEVKDAMVSFGGGLLPAVDRAGKGLRTFFEDNQEDIKAFGKAIGESMEKIGEFAKELKAIYDQKGWEGVREKLKEIAGDLGSAFVDRFGDTIKKGLLELFNNLSATLNPIANFGTAYSAIKEMVQETPISDIGAVRSDGENIGAPQSGADALIRGQRRNDVYRQHWNRKRDQAGRMGNERGATGSWGGNGATGSW